MSVLFPKKRSPLSRNPKLRPAGDADGAVVHRQSDSRGRRLQVREPQHQETGGAGDFSRLFRLRGPLLFWLVDLREV